MKLLLCHAAVAALVLAGCSPNSDPAPVETDAPASAEPLPESAVARSSPVATGSADSPAAVAEKSIPVALRGSWGMVPADCTSTRGDAKGLITIGATSIRYYESVAKLTKVSERSETALRASYAFSGEGMDWQRELTLKLQDGGKVLIKQEFGSDVPPGPYRYTHCS